VEQKGKKKSGESRREGRVLKNDRGIIPWEELGGGGSDVRMRRSGKNPNPSSATNRNTPEGEARR